MRRIRSPCCARAASGQAPPRHREHAMNSRRLMIASQAGQYGNGSNGSIWKASTMSALGH